MESMICVRANLIRSRCSQGTRPLAGSGSRGSAPAATPPACRTLAIPPLPASAAGGQPHRTTSMAATAAAITAVPTQPKNSSPGVAVNRPIAA